MTIEERADKLYRLRYLKGEERERMKERRKDFLLGATEQKAIDEADLQTAKDTYYNAGYETAKNKMIDKACAYCCSLCIEHTKEECPSPKYCKDILDFRKAMEEV